MRAALLVCLALLVSCGQVSTPERKTVEAANAYLASLGYSRFTEDRRVTVRDDGKQWAVVYHLSEGAAGGDIVVFVDKQSRRGVSLYLEQ